jgi:hypothetical protein
MPHYTHILEVLAHVRIGCILVDLVNQQSDRPPIRDDDGNDDDDMGPIHKNSSISAMDALVDLLSTLLHSVRREHPPEILSLVPQAISACLCDYHPSQGGIPFPIPILDVLLKCIGQGPTQFIIVPATTTSTDASLSDKTNKERGKKRTLVASSGAIQQMEVPNPTYQVAAQVIRSLLNRIAEPISQLLNGLLNGEPFFTDQSSIRCLLAVNTSDVESNTELLDSAKKNKATGRNVIASTSAVTTKFQMDWNNSENNEVYTIAYEFHRVAPQILATVVGTIVHGLHSTSTIQRYGVTQFFGQLFAVQNGKYASDYGSCFRDWLNRKHDIVPSIRLCVVRLCMSILQATTFTNMTPNATTDGTSLTVEIDSDHQYRYDVAFAVTEALSNLLSSDPLLDVRTEAIHLVCDWIYQTTKATSTSSHSKENGLILQLLQAVASRVSSKQKQERRDAVTGLAHIYCKHYIQPNLQPVITACVASDKNDSDFIDEDVVMVSIQALHEMFDNVEDVVPKHRSKWRSSSCNRRSNNEDNDDEYDYDYKSGATPKDMYRWIPSKVLECVCFTDSTDTEMRSRIVQIMDEFLLKVSSSTDKQSTYSDKNSNNINTARAIGWTTLLDSLVGDPIGESVTSSQITLLQMTNKNYHRYTSTAFKFLQQLLSQRATLQVAASRYIDARAQIRNYESGMFSEHGVIHKFIFDRNLTFASPIFKVRKKPWKPMHVLLKY